MFSRKYISAEIICKSGESSFQDRQDMVQIKQRQWKTSTVSYIKLKNAWTPRKIYSLGLAC